MWETISGVDLCYTVWYNGAMMIKKGDEVMRVKSVHVTYGRKWNLDHYESAEVGIDVWGQVGPGESAADVAAVLWQFCKEEVATQSLPLLVKRNERRRAVAEEVLNGLPKDFRDVIDGVLHAQISDVDEDGPLPEAVSMVLGRAKKGAAESGETGALSASEDVLLRAARADFEDECPGDTPEGE